VSVGGAGIVGASAAHGMAVNTWYYIEWQIKLHDTTGFTSVRINGVQMFNVTNVDTKNAGTKTTYDRVRLNDATANSGVSLWFDDLYITTGAGATFKGSITIP